jgi:hypothetical protein
MSAPQFNLPSPGVVTSQQIRDLLSALATLDTFFRPANDSVSTPARLEGEAAVAVTTTLIKTCARLDRILDEDSRWSIDAESKVLATLQKNYEQQYEFLKAQTEGAQVVSKPSYFMKPQIACLGDGSFIAYTGDISVHGCGLIGRGATPKAAFDDYDAAFKREAKEQISIDPSSTQTEQPPKTRKKK